VHQLVLFLYIHKSLFLLSFIPYFCSPFHIYYFIIFEIVRNAFVRRWSDNTKQDPAGPWSDNILIA
jgi:hypothetical protein